tara:strand:+ start:376 stop:891 length:516 start_codon:yes stop_codon:yes gene_type:complete
MKTIIKISKDYYSDLAYESKVDDINMIVNEINVLCEVRNDKFINLIEQEQRYSSEKEDYKNKIVIEAKGYCQSEWQTHTLYYNEKELKIPQHRMYLSDLIQHLERSFTHNNDYFVEKYEQTKIDGKIFNAEANDYTSFCITHTEFPEDSDIIEEYKSIYGEDYDTYIIDNN